MSLKNSIIVLWIYVMYLIAIWVFFSGYLLKRIVVNRNSTEISNTNYHFTCRDLTSLNSMYEKFNSLSDGTCINSRRLKRHDKLILIIIDGLRYDFAIYNDSIPDDINYLNKLPVFTEMKEKFPNRCLLSEIIADPPTTTLQRLSGITTGSLPTFIDLSLNFASSSIQEDNIIWQLNKMGKKIVFMGDETWETLFPMQFHRSFPFPSFNVKDLHTVDNGILSNIYNEMEKEDWDVIIAHFLGVDHCGHRYGSNHPAMADKLQQIDTALRDIMDKMGNDTLIAVLGDHGMTETGDHGGDSYNEVSTALFLYSHQNIIHGESIESEKTSIPQINLVPTLALLLGLPIPFSNLGWAIPHLFKVQADHSRDSCFDDEIDSSLGSALAMAENAYQVSRYIQEYNRIYPDISDVVLTEVESLRNQTNMLWLELDSRNTSTSQAHAIFRDLLSGYATYIKKVQLECSKKWAKFNLRTMNCGCIILCIAIYLNISLAKRKTITVFPLIVLVLGACIVVSVIYYGIIIYSVICFIFLLILCFLYYRNSIKRIFLDLIKLLTLPNAACVLLLLGAFSNSFVVYEDAVVLFLLQTVIAHRFGYKIVVNLHTACATVAEKGKKAKAGSCRSSLACWALPIVLLCLLIFVRLSYVFQKCREEQIFCRSSGFLISLENLSDSGGQVLRLGVSWTAVLVPVVAAVVSANWALPEKNYTAAMICINYGLVFVSICICLHWWLAVIPSQVLDRMLGQNQVIAARCALVMSAVIFCCTWLFPLLPEKPLDCPSNRVFSGSLLLFVSSVLLSLYVTAGDGLALSLTLMALTLFAILILDGATSESTAHQATSIVLWWLSSQLWFYGTGHQPTFPSIHWDAAFVLSKEVVSYTLSAGLVLMNTFASQILHGIALPLLLVWSKPPKELQKPLFHLVLKYISLHALKLFASMLSCYLLRRHLMVWKVFTPKLIFEGAGFLVTMASTFLGYLFVSRITACLHKQIKKNAGQLWFLKNE